MPKSSDNHKNQKSLNFENGYNLLNINIDRCQRSSNIEFDRKLNSALGFKGSLKKCKNHSILELNRLKT
ncbi:hypothetical protein DU74_12085 [Methanosarcina mazei]|uniref:Uncharacterized protein n=1 Tax=Methanosarcina mazei TaxID=2209 RepID=A0A0F8RIT1_METMZ|nr:hypothetical protein DU74_12085 [Methanosarcina mazei]